MAKARETSTEKDVADIGDFSDISSIKKPNWVNLAQLDGPLDDSMANNLLYKPALRFHGLTGGLWGPSLSGSPSVVSESRPPSYRFSESVASRYKGDSYSTSDPGSIYKTANLAAMSPLTLRRRNTVAVVFVAIALLAAIATTIGIILHFMHPKAMLRANVRFVIANRNFTDDMRNTSAPDFRNISKPLCDEMEIYFLTSELADFYLGCNVISMSEATDKPGLAVHYSLDFIDNTITNDGERIRKIIMRKSGRQKSEDTLFLVIQDLLVYLRSLRIGLELIPVSGDHPTRNRPRIPWRDDLDFIARKSDNVENITDSILIDIHKLTPVTVSTLNQLSVINIDNVPKRVLPAAEDQLLRLPSPAMFIPATVYDNLHALHVPTVVARVPFVSDVFHRVKPVSVSHFVRNHINIVHGVGGNINPTKASTFMHTKTNTIGFDGMPFLSESHAANAIRTSKYPRNRLGTGEPLTDTGKHNNFVIDSIQASFTQPTEMPRRNIFATQSLYDKDHETITYLKNSNKIFTIYTNVFRILGKDTRTYGLHDKTSHVVVKTPDNNIHAQTRELLLSTQDILSTEYDYKSLSSSQVYKNIPTVEMETELPVQHLNEFMAKQNKVSRVPVTSKEEEFMVPIPNYQRSNITSKQTSNPFTIKPVVSSRTAIPRLKVLRNLPINVHVSPLQERIEIPFPLRRDSNYSPNIPIFRSIDNVTSNVLVNAQTTTKPFVHLQNEVIELNELVQDYPVQDNTHRTNENIHWINIINVPTERTMIRAGDVQNIQDPNEPIGQTDNSHLMPLNIIPTIDRDSISFLNTEPSVGGAGIRDKDRDHASRTKESRTNIARNALNDHNQTIRSEFNVFDDLGLEAFGTNLQQDSDRILFANNVKIQSNTSLLQRSKINDPSDIGQHQTVSTNTGTFPNRATNMLRQAFKFPRNNHDTNVPFSQTVNTGANMPIVVRTRGNIFHNDVGNAILPELHQNVYPSLPTASNIIPIAVGGTLRRDNSINGRRRPQHHLPTLNGLSNSLETSLQIDGNGNNNDGNGNNKGRQGSPRMNASKTTLKLYMNSVKKGVTGHTPTKAKGQDQIQGSGNRNENESIKQIRRFSNNLSNSGQSRLEDNTIAEDVSRVLRSQTGFKNRRDIIFMNSSSDNNKNRYTQKLTSISNYPNNQHRTFRKTSKNTMYTQPWAFLNSVGVIPKLPYAQTNIDNAKLLTERTYKDTFVRRHNGNSLNHNTPNSFTPVNIYYKGNKRQMLSKSNQFNGQHNHNALMAKIQYNAKYYYPYRHLIKLKYNGGYIGGNMANDGQELYRRPAYPYTKTYMGLPKSSNYTDITEMKDVLKQLVNTMYNMTEKIDTMQAAIDFINKTFHDTHEPLFRLKDTLGNMTVSLDNLNQNLRDINQTLNGFKRFLKQFDNTVFNIDDIIKHLDDAVNNLDKTVNYIGSSMADLNGTANNVVGSLVDIDDTLHHINQSVFDVNHTAVFTNKTLDSMDQTLHNLEDAINGLNIKVDNVVGAVGVINLSLNNINGTIKNSHLKLTELDGKLQNLNGTVGNLERTIVRLNKTYTQINETLVKMNEPYLFTNGTVLEVIQQLTDMDKRLSTIIGSMLVMHGNMSGMNDSLKYSIKWMHNMATILKDFNVNMERNNDTIKLSLRDVDLIETVGLLLNMNETIIGLGQTVDEINKKLDDMDETLSNLDTSLGRLETTLSNINASFIMLNKSLTTVNTTMQEMSKSLDSVNSTVEKINGSFIDLNSTFENINNALNAVNETLVKINETAMDINSTSVQVLDTLEKMNKTILTIATSVESLNSSINTMGGPLQKLNNQLHNANESIRMNKGKADIIVESYNMLANTIEGMDKTVNELLMKLTETIESLYRTNSSFDAVNTSIGAIESSFYDISNTLNSLQLNFSKMNESMGEISSAFPNLMKTISYTQSLMNGLKQEMDNVKTKLDLNYDKRNSSLDRYTDLDNTYKSVFNSVSRVRGMVNSVKNISSSVKKYVDTLQRNLIETDNNYLKVAENIQHLNKTFQPLHDRFNAISLQSEGTNKDLQMVNNSLTETERKLKELVRLTEDYPNLYIPIEDMKELFRQQLLNFTNAKQQFDKWTDNFTKADTILWDKDGHPTGVLGSFDSLRNGTETVNATLHGYSNILHQTASSVSNIIEMDSALQEAFDRINQTRQNIDRLKMTDQSLDTLIQHLKRELDEHTSNFSEIVSNLERTLAKLKYMKNEYGNINGTYNSTERYSDIDDRIARTITEEIDKFTDDIKETESKFWNSIERYRTNNETYQKTIITTTPTSHKLLNDTFEVMQNTNVSLHDVNINMRKLSEFADKINKSLLSIVDDINNFDSDLQERQTKNNYVVSSRPEIEKTFNYVDVSLNQSNDNLETLYAFLDKLQDIADNITRRNMKIPNMNISVIDERKRLSNVADSLSNLVNKSTTAKNALESARLAFDDFRESNYSLDEIKVAYTGYRQTLVKLQDTVNYITSKTSMLNHDLNETSVTFDDILRLMDKFEETDNRLGVIGISLNNMNANLRNTSAQLNFASENLIEIQSTLDAIKQNYTNFTATDIDISESYVNEAILEIRDSLDKLTLQIDLATLQASDTTNKFHKTNQTMHGSDFIRTNIDNVLDSDVIPKTNELVFEISDIDNAISRIKAKIRRLDVSLQGVNETLLFANDKLFVDRQKQLLSDNKFPFLEDETYALNKSIEAAETLTNATQSKINDIMKMYTDINKRLERFPTVNMSMNEYEKTIQKLNSTLKDVIKNLIDSKDILKKINATMLTDRGERYSTNETLNEIKDRYQKAESMIDNLTSVIDDLETVISQTQNSSDVISKDLVKFNTSLDEFEIVDNKVGNLLDDLADIEKQFNVSIVELTNIELHFDRLADELTNVSNRFANINHTVFDSTVIPFKDKIQHRHLEFDKLQLQIREAMDILNTSKSQLLTANKTLNEQINDKDNLYNITKQAEEAYKNVTTLFIKMNNIMADIKLNSTNLDEKLGYLDNDLVDIISKFKRQEKDEYFNNYYPKERFEATNKAMIRANSLHTSIEDKLHNTKSDFSTVNGKLNSFTNIHINNTVIEIDLNDINMSLDQNKQTIKDLIQRHNDVEKYLFAEDGSHVSNNETIEHMKDRYKKLNDVLGVIDGTLSEITENMSHHANSTLDKHRGRIADIDSLLDMYKSTIDSLKNTKNTIGKLNSTLKETSIKNSDREILLDTLETDVNDINTSYIDVYSEDINTTKDTVGIILLNAKHDMHRIKANTTKAAEQLSKARDILNMFVDDIQNEFNDTKEIESVLKRFDNTEDLIHRTVSKTPETIKTIQENRQDLDKTLTQLDGNVTTLRDMLIAQNKNNFIQENAPKLQNSFHLMNKNLLVASNKLSNLAGELTLTNETYLKTKDNIQNEPNMNISLADSKYLIDSTAEDLHQYDETIISLRNVMDGIDINVINETGNYFHQDDTIEFIKERFDAINRTLNRIQDESKEVSGNLNITEKDLGKEGDYLKALVLETVKFVTLKEDIAETNASIDLLNTNIAKTKQEADKLGKDIDYLDAIVNDISDNYKYVNSTDLHNEANAAKRNLNNIKHRYLKVVQELSNLTNGINETDNERLSLSNIMNNISTSIEDLKYQLHTASSSKQELENQGKSLNTSTTELKMRIEPLKQNVRSLNDTLTNLEEGFRKQQIVDYIQNKFPKVLQKYQDLNDSLAKLSDTVPDTSKQLEKLQNQMSDINATFASHPSIVFPMDNKTRNYENMATKLHDIIANKTKVINSFERLGKSLTSSVLANETLDDIKTRFELYNETMTELDGNISGIEHVLANIDNESEEASKVLSTFDNEINRFDKTAHVINNIEALLKTIGSSLNDTNSTFIKTDTTLDELNDKLLFVKQRFQGVNSIPLYNKTSTIGDLISKEQFDINTTKENIESVFQNLNHSIGDVLNISRNMVQNISDIQELSAILDNVENAIPALRSDIDALFQTDTNSKNDLKRHASNTKELQDAIKDLANEYKEKEKLDFIQENAPILHNMFQMLNDTLYHVNGTVKKLQEGNTFANKSFYDVNLIMEKEPTINISLTTDNHVIQSTANSLRVNSDNIIKMKDILNNLDTNLITDYGNYFDKNETIENIKNKYNAFNNTLKHILDNVHAVDSNLQNIDLQLRDENKYLNELFEQSNKYGGIKDQTGETTGNIAKLNTDLNIVKQVVNTLAGDIENLNSTLNDISKRYRDVNSTELHSEARIAEQNLKAIKGPYLDIVRELSNVSNTMNETNVDIDKLTALVSNISTSLEGLKGKITAGRYLMEVVDAKANTINESASNIHKNVKPVKDNIFALNTSLNTLKEKYRQQQIVDYIQKKFPSVLDKYKKVNGTLEKLSDNESNTSDHLKSLEKHITDVNSNLVNHSSIDLSLNDIRTNLQNMKSDWTDAFYAKKNATDMFKQLQEKMSSSVSNNETLQDIIKRFGAYNETLVNLENALSSIENKIGRIDNRSMKAEHKLSAIDVELDRFDRATHGVDNVNALLKTLNNNLNDTQHRFTATHNIIDKQIEKTHFIENRFKNVHSVPLHETTKYIEKRLSNETTKKIATKEDLDSLSKRLNRTQEDFGYIERSMLQPISDITVLSTVIDNIELATEKMNEYIDMDADNLNAKLKPDVLEQLSTAQQLQEDISDLIDKYADKEKHDYIQGNAPVLRDVFQRINDTLHQVHDSVLDLKTENDNVNTTLYMAKNVTEMEPAINIASDNEEQVIHSTANDIILNGNAINSLQNVLNKLDMGMINDPGQYFDQNDTIDYVKDKFEAFNKTLNDIHNTKDILNGNLQVIESQLRKENDYLKEFLQESVTLEVIKQRANTTNINIDKMNKTLASIRHTTNELGHAIENMNSTLNNISKRYGDANSSALHKEENTIKHKIEQIKETYNDIVQELSNITLIMNQTDFNMDNFSNIIKSVSTSLENLRKRNHESKDIGDKIESDIMSLNSSTADFQLLLPPLANNISSLTDTLSNLENKFKKQQIVDYIKKHFPSVLHKYENVNGSLSKLLDGVPRASEQLSEMYYYMANVSAKLNNHTTIQLPIEIIRQEYEILASGFQNANGIKVNVVNTFSQLEKALSNSASENETLDDIKNRFLEYNETLTDLENVISDIDETLKGVDNGTTENTKALSTYDDVIKKYDDLSQGLSNSKDVIQKLGNDLDLVGKTVAATNTSIDELLDKMNYITERFKDVSSPHLQAKRNDTEQQIIKEYTDLVATRERLDNISRQSDNLNTTFNTIAESMGNAISDVKSLYNMLDIVNNSISVTQEDVRQTINTLDASVNITLAVQIPKLEQLHLDVDDLMLKFTEQEKLDFINNTLPIIVKQYYDTKTLFTDTKIGVDTVQQELDSLNATISDLEDRLSAIPNVNISTNELNERKTKMHNGVSLALSSLENATQTFNGIDATIFKNKDWRNFTLESVNKTITDMQRSFDNTLKRLHSINKTSLNMLDNITDDVSDIMETETVLNRLVKLNVKDGERGTALDTLQADIDATGLFLENITKIYQSQSDKLKNLTALYTGVTNNVIEKNFDVARNIIPNTVGLRLPRANTLFNNRLLDKYPYVRQHYKNVNSLLNNNYTDRTVLNNVLDGVEDSLMNITLETEGMISDKEHYKEDSKQLNQLLGKSEPILNELELLLKSENKRVFIDETLPDMLARGLLLQSNMQNISQSLSKTNATIDNLTGFLTDIENTMDTIIGVNISNSKRHEELVNAKTYLDLFQSNLLASNSTFNKISLLKLDKNELIENDTLNLTDVEDMFKEIKSALSDIESGVQLITDDNANLDSNLTVTANHLGLLNETLNCFNKIERKLLAMDDTITSIDVKRINVNDGIDNVTASLNAFNSSLNDLKHMYKDFDYNSTLTETLIFEADTAIKDITLKYKGVVGDFEEIRDELSAMNGSLLIPHDDRGNLNKTLAAIKVQIVDTSEKLGMTNTSIDSLLHDIPSVNMLLQLMDNHIKVMNTTLQNEDRKSKFVDGTLPALEEKYRLMNMTFDMTNKTLELMAEKMTKLKEYVEYVRRRMDAFPSLNISLSDSDMNITHLEDRLVIMQHHYNNVQDVVNKLKTDLQENDIFGKNISLDDVRDKYKEFNVTLENIDTVLTKIDNEFYQMNNHFEVLNDTLGDINQSLNTFEEAEMNTHIMKTDIDSVNDTISAASDSITGINKTLHDVNDTFYDIKRMFKDVIETTADNNSAIANHLKDATHALDVFNAVVHKLSKDRDVSLADFESMNTSLYHPIDNFKDLNNTLAQVGQSHKTLSISLKNITDELRNASQNTAGINSSVSDLVSYLDDLNRTLSAEQKKYDYINSNFGNVESKFKDLKFPLAKTNTSLENASNKLASIENILKDVSAKLKVYPTVSISLHNEIKQLNESKRQLKNLTDEYDAIKKIYDNVQSNITALSDRSKDISEIQSRYDNVSAALNNVKEKLVNIEATLSNIDNSSMSIAESANSLNVSLDSLGNLNATTNSIGKNIVALGEAIEGSGIMLLDTKDTANNLEKDLISMQQEYDIVDDAVLKKNVTDILRKLREEQLKLKEVNLKKTKIADTFTGLDRQFSMVTNALNDSIATQQILENTIKSTTDRIEDVDNKTAETTLKLNELSNEAESIRNIVETLEDQIKQINQSMFEEKQKIEYVNANFPDMQKHFNVLAENIGHANDKLNHANETVDVISTRLFDIQDRLDKFPAIDIVLDSQNNDIKNIRDELRQLREYQANTSTAYSKLSLADLTDRNKSLSELKQEFIQFNSSLKDVNNRMEKMEENIPNIDDTGITVNNTITDLNSAVDSYVKVSDDVENIIKRGDAVTIRLKDTNQTVNRMTYDMKVLNDSVNTLLNKFSHIKDPNLVKAIESIQVLISHSKGKVDLLGESMTTLEDMTGAASDDIGSMNDTLHSAKKLLSELKRQIGNINQSSDAVNNKLKDIHKHQEAANKTADEISPELNKLMKEINDLSNAYVQEQEKLDYISKFKPTLLKMYKNIDDSLIKTNKHVSLTEVELANLRYDIQTTDKRLNKFKTLNITTNPEENEWTDMSYNVKNLSNEFTNASKIYKDLMDEMNTLDDRNVSIAVIQKRFKKINATMTNIDNVLTTINGKLDIVVNDSKEIDSTLSGFKKVMDEFKRIQTDVKSTEELLQKSHVTVSGTVNTTSDMSNLINTSQALLTEMATNYKPLNDAKWEKSIPEFKKNITTHKTDANALNKTLGNLQEIIASTSAKIKSVSDVVQNKIMTRADVNTTLKGLESELRSTKESLSSTDKPFRDLNSKLLKTKSVVMDIRDRMGQINETLHKELEKQEFVNSSLPDMREKHTTVNTSFVSKNPEIEDMKNKIAYLVSIVTKIKEKMQIFGVKDTDNSVKLWDTAMQQLNTTVTKILDANKKHEKALQDLKSKLWSNDSMYTSQESLPDIKSRFAAYGKLLDDIAASTHSINLKLNDADTLAVKVTQELMERDSILTTTPATTTPSGPPEWMHFTSTANGVIGKDSATAVCSVDDLSQWNIMKITRVQLDGKEDVIAAWKLGVGARKAVSDRRIRIKKTEDASKGNLAVNIRTLQCKDQGKYYCAIDAYHMWPLTTNIGVITPPENDLKPDFPTEVFEDKTANFSCSGKPGYPNGRLIWKIQQENDRAFKNFDFYSAKSKSTDEDCVRSETNTVEHQFEKSWNNTKIRCYIENTDYYGEGIIRLLPYDICNTVRYQGTVTHPYTPHKYIVCGKRLNIMQCPGNTCYDNSVENCVQCKASHGGGDPCLGKSLYSYVAHETDCKRYYTCLGPTKKLNLCPVGSYFAPNTPGNCVIQYSKSHCAQKAG